MSTTRFRLRRLGVASAVLAMFVASNSTLMAQDGWTVSTSILYSRGSFLSQSTNNIFYFYAGGGYQSERWGINVSIPLVNQTNGGASQVGGMILSNGNTMGSNNGSMSGGGMMGNSGGNTNQGTTSSSTSHSGIGDILLSGSYNICSEDSWIVGASANAFLKIPSADQQNGFGTGKLDNGYSLSVKKSVQTFVVLGDVGYMFLGNPANVSYIDPISYGLGIGKYFEEGRYSLLLYYQGYSKILDGYNSPQTLALGINDKISSNVILTLIGSKGLSDVTPDLSLSVGMKWTP